MWSNKKTDSRVSKESPDAARGMLAQVPQVFALNRGILTAECLMNAPGLSARRAETLLAGI